MSKYLLEPEVAGELGENTVIRYENGRIKEITHLHYEFHGWLGDELLTTNPCFIVTESLANAIQKSDCTGYEFKDVEISSANELKDSPSSVILPKFKWLIPNGILKRVDAKFEWSGDDFCLEDGIELIVTEKALKILKTHRLENCEITEIFS